MSVSSISTSSSYAVSSQQRPQRPNDEISSGVDSLLKAVQSGDKDAIQSAYDSLSSTVSSKNSSSSSSSSSSSTTSTSSTSDSDNPVSKLLSTVSDALKSGDVSNLAATLQAQAPQGAGGSGGPGGAGGPPPGGPPPEGAEGPSDEVKSAIGDLAESLSSGDLSSAQSSYSALSDLLSSAASSDSSSSSSTTSTSSTSSSSSSGSDKFSSTLSDIGSALDSGNLSQAQQLFSSLLPRGSSVNVYA